MKKAITQNLSQPKKRKRWNKEEHARWQEKVNRGVVHDSSDWAKIRADRVLISRPRKQIV